MVTVPAPSASDNRRATPEGVRGLVGVLAQLAVVPKDVVYRREVGVAPPMPPCGRR